MHFPLPLDVTVSLSASSFNIMEPLGGEMPMNVCVVVEGSFARSESVVVFIEVTEGSASSMLTQQ